MNEPDDLTSALQEWMDAYVHRSMRASILHFKSLGLSMSHFSAMMRLEHGGPCGVSDIAEHLGITPAAASQLLEKLVQQGYVTRSEAAHDRRLKTIALSEGGRQALAKNICLRDQWMSRLSAALTPPERQQVAEAIRLLVSKVSVLDEDDTLPGACR